MASTINIATKLAKDYKITIASAKTMVVTVLDTIIEIAKTERIKIGDHIFKPFTSKKRNGRNPSTGAPLVIPEKHSVKYKYTGDRKVEPVAPTAIKAKPKRK